MKIKEGQYWQFKEKGYVVRVDDIHEDNCNVTYLSTGLKGDWSKETLLSDATKLPIENSGEGTTRNLLIETAMRTRIGFPQTKQQDEWFREGVSEHSEFMERLFNEIYNDGDK